MQYHPSLQHVLQCWCGDDKVDRHGTAVCTSKCAGGEYACGGSYAITVYELTSVVEYEPEVVSGATYLDCYKDERDDRVMVRKETRDDMTATVRCDTLVHAFHGCAARFRARFKSSFTWYCYERIMRRALFSWRLKVAHKKWR